MSNPINQAKKGKNQSKVNKKNRIKVFKNIKEMNNQYNNDPHFHLKIYTLSLIYCDFITSALEFNMTF